MRQLKDFTGKVFGKLTVVGVHKRVIGRHAIWECICKCGNTVFVQANNLQSGNTKSCNCQSRETNIKRLKKDYKKEYPNSSYNNSGISKQEYANIHQWLKTYYGKAKECEHCSKCDSKKYEWALKKGCQYSRNRDSFIQLCTGCHHKYDLVYRPVVQFDKNMQILSVYESIAQAAKSINRSVEGIYNNLGGKCKSSYGYIWEYQKK